jgi:hypothetical protein
MKWSNKADAPNAAIALRFHCVGRWRGVGDPRRSSCSLGHARGSRGESALEGPRRLAPGKPAEAGAARGSSPPKDGRALEGRGKDSEGCTRAVPPPFQGGRGNRAPRFRGAVAPG